MKKLISAAVVLALMIGFAEWSVGIVEQKLEETGRQNEAKMKQQLAEINRKQQDSMRRMKERVSCSLGAPSVP